MPEICGISLRGSQCTLILLSIGKEGDLTFVDRAKITLKDDDNQNHVRDFLRSIQGFVADHKIETIAVRGRAKAGGFPGGAITFKMEALIQSNERCAVHIVSPQTIAACLKRNESKFVDLGKPLLLKEAYDAAFCFLRS